MAGDCRRQSSHRALRPPDWRASRSARVAQAVGPWHRERDVLGRFGVDLDLADVFLGKKPFGILTNSTAVSTKVSPATPSTKRRCARHQSRPARTYGASTRRGPRTTACCACRWSASAARGAALAAPSAWRHGRHRRAATRPPARSRPRKRAAEHRDQRQRHHRRHQDRQRHHRRELVEQQPDHARHEEDRDEHRHQRDRDRQDGEAHLARAHQRGLERRHAFLDVPHDVLEHHDGVVHHQAHRQRDGQQGDVVRGCSRTPSSAPPCRSARSAGTPSGSAWRRRGAGTGRSPSPPAPRSAPA